MVQCSRTALAKSAADRAIWTAYVLHHALRALDLAHTELARAEPGTVIVRLFKFAVRVVPKKRRVHLHLATTCSVKDLLHRAREILYLIKPTLQPA